MAATVHVEARKPMHETHRIAVDGAVDAAGDSATTRARRTISTAADRRETRVDLVMADVPRCGRRWYPRAT